MTGASEPQRPPDDPREARLGGTPPIVFVGGTGRSGTHVVAELLGHHRHYAAVPIESRFHANPQGFEDLLAGEVSPAEFLRKLRSFWWYRIPAGEPMPALLPKITLGRDTRGLYKFVPEGRMAAAIDGFEARFTADPELACRKLFLDILWPVAAEAGKPGLVEMSTHTVARAPTLLRLFPEAKLIHVVRDGRDSGSSKVGLRQKDHHPSDVREGINWWAERIERIERSLAQVPDEKVVWLRLDALTETRRGQNYNKILRSLELDDDPEMRAFFRGEMDAEGAHSGRWREGLGESDQGAIEAEYSAKLDQMIERGFQSAVMLRRALDNELEARESKTQAEPGPGEPLAGGES